MCKRILLLMFLFTFVGTAFAVEDRDPPYWQGAEGSSYAFYELEEEAIDGVFYADVYVGDDELHVHPESLWAVEGPDIEGVYAGIAEWDYVIIPEYEGRSGVFQVDFEILAFINNYPRDYDRFKRLRIQAVVHSPGEEPELGAECETADAPWTGENWNYWPGYFWEQLEAIDLGDGWWNVSIETDTHNGGTEDFTLNPGSEVFFLFAEEYYCDSIIMDTICYEGDEPPAGGGDRAPAPQVSSPTPTGAIATTEDLDLTFYAPSNAYFMIEDSNITDALDTWGCPPAGDPCDAVDPNNFLQGPFEYSVFWGGTDPCSDNMTLLDPPGAWFPSPADDTGDQQVAENPNGGPLAAGTTYYWRVDINDINTQDFRCGGTAVEYTGPVFSYSTWGKAILEEPASGTEFDITITPDPNLVWYNDGYAASFELYLYRDEDGDPETTGDLTLISQETSGDETPWPADPNAWVWEVNVPLVISTLYVWRVDEVNTAGTGTGDLWYFSTLECETLDDFEYANTTELDAVWTEVGEATIAIPVSGAYNGDWAVQITFPRAVLGTDNDYLERTYTTGQNWRSGGGKALNIAYKVAANAPVPATDDVYLEIVSNGTPGRVDLAGDITNTEWEYMYTALQAYEDAGADPCDVDAIRIGFASSTTSGTSPQLVFDDLGRCGSQCVPEQLAPTYDLTGDCAVNWDDMDIIVGNWLDEDYLIYPEEPCAPNLLLALEFASDFSDSSSNAYDTKVYGSPSAPAGFVTLNGINQWIEVLDINQVNPFDGDVDFTISATVRATEAGIIMSSARPQGALDEEAYGAFHSMAFFTANEGAAIRDSFYVGAVECGWPVSFDNEWENIVTTFVADGNASTGYLDGFQGEEGDFDPNIPNPEEDTIAVGTSLNEVFPSEGGEFSDQYWDGDIDFVRVYDYALSQEEAMYETTGSTTPVEIPVSELANTYVDGAFGSNIINFLDYSEVANEWLVGPLLFPDDL